MTVVPPLLGGIIGGFRPIHLLLLAFWLVAFCAYCSLSLWFKAAKRRRGQFTKPVLVYCCVAVLLGAALAALAPAILLWAPLFLIGIAISVACLFTHNERGLLNDIVTIVVSSLTVPLAVGMSQGAGWSRLTQSWLPPGADDATAWFVFAVVAIYFVGTVFYVKTMIRERGKRGWLAASVIYHLVALVLAGIFAGWPIAAVALIAAVRSYAVPKLLPHWRPKQVGMSEAVLTVLLVAAVLLTVF